MMKKANFHILENHIELISFCREKYIGKIRGGHTVDERGAS